MRYNWTVATKVGSKAIKPNPKLKPLEVLIGEWDTDGSHPYFPGKALHGRTVFEWIEGGAFLLLRSEIDNPKFPDGIEIFGSDDAAGTFYMLHFDERGVSRKYDVAIEGNQIKWWRDEPSFRQRYILKIEDDKLVGLGEMSRNGSAWEPDLSLTYIRAS